MLINNLRRESISGILAMYEQSEAASVKKDTNIFKLFILRLFFTTIANINNETDQKSLFSRPLFFEVCGWREPTFGRSVRCGMALYEQARKATPQPPQAKA